MIESTELNHLGLLSAWDEVSFGQETITRIMFVCNCVFALLPTVCSHCSFHLVHELSGLLTRETMKRIVELANQAADQAL